MCFCSPINQTPPNSLATRSYPPVDRNSLLCGPSVSGLSLGQTDVVLRGAAVNETGSIGQDDGMKGAWDGQTGLKDRRSWKVRSHSVTNVHTALMEGAELLVISQSEETSHDVCCKV